MIVVDASAAVAALLNDGQARSQLRSEQLHAPHLIDAEIAQAMRRLVAGGTMSAAQGWSALDTWRRIGIRRSPVVGLLPRIWRLRDTVTAYDASYVALAEVLGCPLLTADARLSRAPGVNCAVTVVPG
ncbi:MAG: type II toxin-antitoxin system VapC family toxin [Actinomycetota bacterium]|nr:type II toxin-antitoxin system VapC family toxin [Actinomycetota bacterium]MDQ2847031.1 type II toxin-antitoxin system VapC family toxin [Actinomycetota bacterium]